MSFLQMAVRVCAVALFGMLLVDPAMLCMMVVLPAVQMPRMLCNTMSSAGWETYSLTLPAGRQRLVASQFVLMLCCNAVTAMLGMTGMAIGCAVTGMVGYAVDDLARLLVCIVVGYMVIAVFRRIGALRSVWQFWSGQLAAWLVGREIAAA